MLIALNVKSLPRAALPAANAPPRPVHPARTTVSNGIIIIIIVITSPLLLILTLSETITVKKKVISHSDSFASVIATISLGFVGGRLWTQPKSPDDAVLREIFVRCPRCPVRRYLGWRMSNLSGRELLSPRINFKKKGKGGSHRAPASTVADPCYANPRKRRGPNCHVFGLNVFSVERLKRMQRYHYRTPYGHRSGRTCWLTEPRVDKLWPAGHSRPSRELPQRTLSWINSRKTEHRAPPVPPPSPALPANPLFPHHPLLPEFRFCNINAKPATNHKIFYLK